MAEYLIQDTTLTGIADAIRAKTGSTDAIKVSDMASKIEGISVGGGTVEGIHYVTFMSEDGSTELYKRPVADGDDCADPVERGLIDAPTKESTAQYDYSFVGWATSPNGAWDENALKAVTEDKTVYAAFASVLRYYTITYYDDDGTTVLTAKSFAYGATPSYTPTKDGYAFAGWVPELTSVTGDTSYTASWANVIASGAINEYTAWALIIGGVLKISGDGAMDDFHYSDPLPPWNGYKDSIKSVVIEDGVTHIGMYAFYKYTNLTSITFADSVRTIDSMSFAYCSGITSVVIPNGVTEIGSGAFREVGIKSIDIPNSVTSVGFTAFNYNDNLETVIIGSGVTKIGGYCFSNCPNLTSVTFIDTDTWYVGSSEGATTTQVDVTDASNAATLLKDTHVSKYWTKV